MRKQSSVATGGARAAPGGAGASVRPYRSAEATRKPSAQPSTDYALAYVGAFAPDADRAGNPAYSPAGTLFQEQLLAGLAEIGVRISGVYSLPMVPSHPRRPLWFGRGTQTLARRFQAELLPFINVGALKPLTAGLSLMPKLARWAWRERRHRRAILVYNVGNPPGIASVLVARLSGTKAIALVADIQVPGSGLLPDVFLRRLDFQLQTRTLPFFDGLVVLTRRMATDFAPRARTLLMEGGVGADMMAEIPETSAPRDGAGSRLVFMYSGSLLEIKGVPLLLDAFSQLGSDAVELWLTGAGPLEERVREASRRDSRIRFFGSVTYSELLALYRQADVLINPHSTTHESVRYLFPSKLLEYLGTGRPVISTCSTPDIRDEYGDVLYLLDEESPAALATAMARLSAMDPATRQAMGARGRAFVATRKSWKRQAARVAHFIASIVDT